MAQFPTMPLRTDALVGDTTHLTTLEFGAYMKLLICMWRNGAWLPNDDRLLAKYAGLHSNQWARSKALLMDFFTVDGDRIYQGRQVEEWESIQQRSNTAKYSADARWRKRKEKGHANAMRTQSERISPGFERNPGGAVQQTPKQSERLTDEVNRLESLESGDADAMRTQCDGNANAMLSSIHIKREDKQQQLITSSVARAGSAAAADDDPFEELRKAREAAFHDRVLEAAGIELKLDTAAKWTNSAQRWNARRWLELGLTEAEVIDVLRDVTARRKNGPPGTLTYFDAAMQEAAGRKEVKLKPVRPTRRPDAESVFGHFEDDN